MVRGECLCGQIVFEIDQDKVALFNNCYCLKCQRHSGAGFVSQIQILKERFSWLKGEDSITHHESSPGVFRAFCTTCGSRLPMTKQDSFVPVPVGLLAVEIDHIPEVNMHLASKRQWTLVDKSIHCLGDQGSDEFWRTFMETKLNDA